MYLEFSASADGQYVLAERSRRIDFEFERRDGLKIHGRITLPVDYADGTRSG